jgi:hypothetical protein
MKARGTGATASGWCGVGVASVRLRVTMGVRSRPRSGSVRAGSHPRHPKLMAPATGTRWSPVVGADQVVGVALAEQVGAVAGDPVRRAPLDRPLAAKGKLDHLLRRRHGGRRARVRGLVRVTQDFRLLAARSTWPALPPSGCAPPAPAGRSSPPDGADRPRGTRRYLPPQRAEHLQLVRKHRPPRAGCLQSWCTYRMTRWAACWPGLLQEIALGGAYPIECRGVLEPGNAQHLAALQARQRGAHHLRRLHWAEGQPAHVSAMCA